MDIRSVPGSSAPLEANKPEVDATGLVQSPANRALEEAAGSPGPVSGPEATGPALNGLELKFHGNLVRERLSHEIAETLSAEDSTEVQAGNSSIKPVGSGVTGPMTEAMRLDSLAHGNDWEYRATPTRQF